MSLTVVFTGASLGEGLFIGAWPPRGICTLLISSGCYRCYILRRGHVLHLRASCPEEGRSRSQERLLCRSNNRSPPPTPTCHVPRADLSDTAAASASTAHRQTPAFPKPMAGGWRDAQCARMSEDPQNLQWALGSTERPASIWKMYSMSTSGFHIHVCSHTATHTISL